MVYGGQIGKKFERDGSPRRYPGNTVIADVRPGCGAYQVMRRLRSMALEAGFGDSLILLPEDSYHMTVLRGLNDQVRTDGFWPDGLPRDASLSAMDAYVSRAVSSVEMPGSIRMRFQGVRVDDEDFRVLLTPADDAQASELRHFRDAAAAAIGLFLPGHADYTYHITLAYTRLVPQDEQSRRLKALTGEMEAYLTQQPAFETTPPYMAYYEDMLAFLPKRIREPQIQRSW